MHHESLIAVLFNEYIAHPIAALFGVHADADHGLIPQHLVMLIIVSFLLICFAFWLRSRLSVGEPGSLQQMLEVFTSGIQGMMRDIIGEDFRRHYPLIGSLFVFILVCNLMGQVPGFVSPTANINVPAALAVISFVYFVFHGVRVHGPLGYLRHFAGPVLLLAPLIFSIEIISTIARMFSLSVRLWGNLFSEELVSGSLASIFPILTPLPAVALGFFASLIQAFVFCMLNMVYIGEAVAQEEH